MSQKNLCKIKENFPNHRRKHKVSLTSWHEVNTKKKNVLWLITNKNVGIIKNPLRIRIKQFGYQYLMSMTSFILFLVISFFGYQFKILRMNWYKCITPFQDNLQFFIRKYLFQCHNSSPSIDYNSKKEVASEMSKYNYSHHHIEFILNCLSIYFTLIVLVI